MGRSNSRAGQVSQPGQGADGPGTVPADGSASRIKKGDWDSTKPGVFNFKTSFVIGIFFGVFTLLLTMIAGSIARVGGNMSGTGGARFGLVLGLLLGVALIGLVLKVLRTRIELLSAMLYKGLWMALIGGAIALGLMAFTPALQYPDCPPGQLCTSVNR